MASLWLDNFVLLKKHTHTFTVPNWTISMALLIVKQEYFFFSIFIYSSKAHIYFIIIHSATAEATTWDETQQCQHKSRWIKDFCIFFFFCEFVFLNFSIPVPLDETYVTFYSLQFLSPFHALTQVKFKFFFFLAAMLFSEKLFVWVI